MVRVDFIKHVRDVELLLGTHQEVEVGEGKLHVLRVADAVGGRLVKVLGEPAGGTGRVGPSLLPGSPQIILILPLRDLFADSKTEGPVYSCRSRVKNKIPH